LIGFDVVIIGGGLSGSYTALNLSKKGYSVLIIEKGDVVEITHNSIQKGEHVKAGVELLDNSRNGIVDARVLKERQQ